MPKRVLVAYATGVGSTADVALAIGEILREQGLDVSVQPVDREPTPEGYDAIVLGSAVRVGRWLPEARDWLEAHAEVLAGKPVALFSMCLSACDPGDPDGLAAVRAQMDQMGADLEIVAQRAFAGALDRSALPLVLRLLVKIMRVPEGDYRDWSAIEAWATELAERLASDVETT